VGEGVKTYTLVASTYFQGSGPRNIIIYAPA